MRFQLSLLETYLLLWQGAPRRRGCSELPWGQPADCQHSRDPEQSCNGPGSRLGSAGRGSTQGCLNISNDDQPQLAACGGKDSMCLSKGDYTMMWITRVRLLDAKAFERFLAALLGRSTCGGLCVLPVFGVAVRAKVSQAAVLVLVGLLQCLLELGRRVARVHTCCRRQRETNIDFLALPAFSATHIALPRVPCSLRSRSLCS